jgi:transposase-like protein
MTERVSPLYCPYCGGEDLRPHASTSAEAARAGAWECRSCTRVFTVTFVGLVVRK